MNDKIVTEVRRLADALALLVFTATIWLWLEVLWSVLDMYRGYR